MHTAAPRALVVTLALLGLTLESSAAFAEEPGGATPPSLLPPSTPGPEAHQLTPELVAPTHQELPPSQRPWPPTLQLQQNPPGEGMTLMVGRWAITMYGLIELDAIYDSTQSFADQIGHGTIARGDTYAGTHGRVIFGVRNSRVGWRIDTPAGHAVRASALIELDFNQPNVPPINTQPEGLYFTSPYPRLRILAAQIETPLLDIIAGQYHDLIGFITYFDPSSVEIPYIPGALAARTPQLRVSRTFRTSLVNLEIAAAVLRGPQSNAGAPSGEAGMRVLFNRWKGVRTYYALGSTVADRAGIALSGALRRLGVPQAFPGAGTPPVPNPAQLATLGWAVSIDALLPVIPRPRRMGNALTVTATYFRGSGIADLLTGPPPGVGGVLPSPPGCINPATMAAVPGCVDPGLVAVDARGRLRGIRWQSFVLGAQYYLPPAGNAWVSFNFSQLNSDNFAEFADPKRGWAMARYYNANLLYDVTPAVRVGLGYMLFAQYNLDGAESRNHRAQVSTYFRF